MNPTPSPHSASAIVHQSLHTLLVLLTSTTHRSHSFFTSPAHRWLVLLILLIPATNLCLYQLPITPASFVIVGPILVSYLAAALPSTVLPPLPETRIPVCANNPVIQASSVDVPAKH